MAFTAHQKTLKWFSHYLRTHLKIVIRVSSRERPTIFMVGIAKLLVEVEEPRSILLSQ